MTTFHIITIFPEIFNSYFNEGILKRAKDAEKIDIKIYNLRDFTTDKHKTVDDTPYGGGPGMVLKIEPIYKCLEHIKKEISENRKDNKKIPIHPVKSAKGGAKLFNWVNLISNSSNKIPNSSVILTSAKGKEYTQADAEKLKELSDVVIICGRYEGVDERVAENLVDEEVSIGKYILTGGEIPAMVIVDSVSRLLDGVLGNEESLVSESHKQEDQVDYPVFTKPEDFNDWKVPDILLSGNHGAIENWRLEKMKTNKK